MPEGWDKSLRGEPEVAYMRLNQKVRDQQTAPLRGQARESWFEEFRYRFGVDRRRSPRRTARTYVSSSSSPLERVPFRRRTRA